MIALLLTLSGLAMAQEELPKPPPPPAPTPDPQPEPQPEPEPEPELAPLDGWSPWQADGSLRLIGSLYPDPVVDSDGTTVGQGPTLDTRLRAGIRYDKLSWKAVVEADFFDGQAAGDPWDIVGTEDARRRWERDAFTSGIVEPRKAFVEGRIGPVGLQGGLTTSHWGLGMLANDGDHIPTFGRTEFGDRVMRVRATVVPNPRAEDRFYISAAGDRVIEDDTAAWTPWDGGEAAWQGIFSVLYGNPTARQIGLYGVYRDQTEADGERKTRVGVVDLYGNLPIEQEDLHMRFALEAATIFGRTDRVQSYNSRDGLKVRSGAATALAKVGVPKDRVFGKLRGGWASGDGDPDDDVSGEFSYDRDFDVGMVIFDELQGAVDAATWAQLNDPENSGGPPEGAEALVGEGAFAGATFVQPAVGTRPLDWLKIVAGATFAWSSQPIAQPFETTRNGGVPTNHLGVQTSGYSLGTELDWKLIIGNTQVGPDNFNVKPALELSGGHYLASENMGGGTHTLLTATGRVRW